MTRKSERAKGDMIISDNAGMSLLLSCISLCRSWNCR